MTTQAYDVDTIDRLYATNKALLDAVKAVIAARDRPHGFPDNDWYEPAFEKCRAALKLAKEQP